MRFIWAALLCLVYFTVSAAPAAALGTSAASAVLIEAESGHILYEKDAHTPRPMASTTKIMTALVVIEAGRLDEVTKVSPSAAATEGSSIYLKPGERISVRNLLYGLMLESGNDAAAALAEHVGGSIEGFASLMNRRAALMGLKSTRFCNPSGLPDQNHYTTAYELALIGRQGLRNPVFAEIVSTKSYKAPMEDGSGVRYFTNGNKLLRLYPHATGMKTGFTKQAGRCLISSAERDGVTLIAVTLNDGNDWNDHMTMHNYGFEVVTKEPVLSPREVVVKRPVGNGKTLVTLSNTEGLSLYRGLSGGYERVISAAPLILAPVKAGDVLGEVSFVRDGRLVASVPLTAQNGVEERPYVKPQIRLRQRFFGLLKSLLLS